MSDIAFPTGTTDASLSGTDRVLVDDGTTTIKDVPASDFLDTDNHTSGTTNKVFTATEQTKLTGIETGADVTDTTNVTAAGALMDSEVINLAQVKAFDTTDYATAAQGATADSAVQNTGDETIAGVKTFSSSPVVPAPTTDLQAATKKYVDDNAGGAPEGTSVLSTGEVGGFKFLREDGDGTCSWQTPSGSGDVVGPASAVDNAVTRFDTTTGKLIQDSVVTIGDTGVIAGSSIDADTNTITNIGGAEFDTDTTDTMAFANGAFLDSPAITVTSNGTVITLSAEKSGGGDCRVVFSTGVYTWDTTPADTVSLTAGSDTSPQINYIYLPESTKTLTASTTGFPSSSSEYAPIATVLCQSAASLQTDGAYKVHAWTDHMATLGSNGHLSHINYWIRQQQATWESGVALTPTVGASTFDVATSSGVILQLHNHSFPAFNTATGSEIYMVNYPADNYKVAQNLTQTYVDVDINGTALGGTGTDFYNLVLWGVVNESDADCKLFLNLPDGAYANDNGSQATLDLEKTAIYNIPSEYTGVGFLIARLTVQENAGTYTIIQNEDLRGTFPSSSAGGGTTGGNEFVDNVFRIQDDADTTKKIAFQASGITTATTRTITMADADIDLANITTIADEAVTLPKMAHIATNRILGRSTAGTGDVESLADGDVRDIIGLATTDTPQFAGVNVGHATDTTIGRTSAGVINVEGDDVLMDSNIGVSVQAYIKNNLAATAAPTTGDDTGDGYAVGSVWIDTTNDKAYVCLDATATAAVWTETTQAGGGGGGETRRLFTVAGTIGTTGTNVANTWVADGTYTISQVNMWLGTAGSGTTTVDINKNGTTIFSANPSITTTDQSNIDAGTLSVTSLASGDVLTLDIDAVAATTKGIDLYVELIYS